MAKKIEIDPFTRIEGHLAISLDVEDGIVRDAKCKGEMFRGFELIMKGRSPLDAQQIVQRICGVCPVSHGLASVTTQEQAYNIKLPENATLIRNIMLAGNYLQSHITHFYHLSALDFIDIEGILNYSGKDRFLIGIKEWVQSELQSKKLFPAAPFLPRYDAEYLKNYQGNIDALSNYFKALDMRATAHQLVAIWAGKMPHMATIVPGGITEKITPKKIALCRSKLNELRSFVENNYRQDLLAVARAFPQYREIGRGCGNYLAFGVFPNLSGGTGMLLPEGALINDKLDQVDTGLITEEVKYSKYTADSGFTKTTPQPDKSGAYSWIKAPRYKGEPMEVGPLARIMIAYASGGDLEVNRVTDQVLSDTGLTLADMDSCIGRHLARLIEAEVIMDHCEQWIEMLDPFQPTCVDFTIPNKASGKGLTEAPRGALGHWIEIENYRVKSYECVVPTTWNCSPKDDNDVPGPVEMSLTGTPVQDEHNPIEAARIVRAYDPCLACAVH
jgi:Ni,Fe-hydrogenase I large subunit